MSAPSSGGRELPVGFFFFFLTGGVLNWVLPKGLVGGRKKGGGVEKLMQAVSPGRRKVKGGRDRCLLPHLSKQIQSRQDCAVHQGKKIKRPPLPLPLPTPSLFLLDFVLLNGSKAGKSEGEGASRPIVAVTSRRGPEGEWPPHRKWRPG